MGSSCATIIPMKAMRMFALPAAAIGLGICLLAFHVGNTDFWWHIKAGQMMRESGWISTDPFAYTRAGQPYLATHPWLAQIILSLVYDVAGWQGITLLRILLVILVFSIPLLQDREHIGVNSCIAVLAATGSRASLTDRPQLFTFLCFSLIATLCIEYLDARPKSRRKILMILPVIMLLWSNLHGAASITGLALMGALFIDQIFSKAKDTGMLFCAIFASGAAMFVTPNGIENITYLLSLFSDRSGTMIAEWLPAPWPIYLQHTLPLWIVAIVSLVFGRRHLPFSLLALLGFGYLSKTAGRHETLFLITALGITVYQLRHSALRERLFPPTFIGRAAASLTVFVIGCFAILQGYRFTVRDDSFGFGVFTPVAGAAAFIDRSGITGPMFNNYPAGGELLFHDQAVFLDGRNIDYGYDYIKRAVDAGTDSVLWNALEEEYAFTHAVFYYPPEADTHPMPYIDLLQNDPRWSLVYLDDWTAVYEKGGSADAYRLITPRMLMRTEMPAEITIGNLRALEQEVLRIQAERPDSKKAPAYLHEMARAFGA